MIPYNYLPHINAILNLASALLILAGFLQIRRGNRIVHRRFMLSALLSSALFLVSYLTYHSHVGSVRFQGRGMVRSLYFAILISHTVLAAFVLPLVIVALTFALKEKFDRHKKLARVAFPVWLYVSVTGVIVYLMLYQLPA